jgi:hypothetical protein
MFKPRNLFLYACAFALSMCGLSYASPSNLDDQAAPKKTKIIRQVISSFSAIPSTGNFTFLDIDGCLLSAAGRRIERDIIAESTLTELERLQNAGTICIALTARTPEDALMTAESFTRRGVKLGHPSLETILKPLGEQYHNGTLFSPRILVPTGREKNPHEIKKVSTKPTTLKTVLTLLRNHGHAVSQISFVDNEEYNFNGMEGLDFSGLGLDMLTLYLYQRTFDPIYPNLALPKLYFLNLQPVDEPTNEAGSLVMVEDKKGHRWILKTWETKERGTLESKNGFLYNDIPPGCKKRIKKVTPKEFLSKKGYFSFTLIAKK